MEKLKQYRKDAGLTQQYLAKKVGKTPACISQYESGVREPPHKVAVQIANVIGCKWQELYGEDGSNG